MKITNFKLKIVGVDNDKEIIIKPKIDLNNFEKTDHKLRLTRYENKLDEDEYILRPFSQGCEIGFNCGEPLREYHFTLGEDFVSKLEDFLHQYIKGETKKIDGDFKGGK